jgi:hypothetical protein
MSNDIHQIGADAVAALKALNQAKAAKKSKTAKANDLIEERNELVKPLLQQVHDSIAGGKPVNGCTTWAGWAKAAGWSKRALNYILNGRKPQTGNSSSRPKLALIMLDAVYNRRKDAKYLALVADVAPVDEHGHEITGGMHVKLDVVVKGTESREILDACAAKLSALMKQLRLWDKETTARFKECLEEVAKERELTSTPTPSAKTHALGNTIGDDIAWTICGKSVHDNPDVQIADNNKKPTCKVCLNHKEYRFGQHAKKNRAAMKARKAQQETETKPVTTITHIYGGAAVRARGCTTTPCASATSHVGRKTV